MLFGCERETSYKWEVGNYVLTRCPVSSITDPQVFRFITAYNRYSKGFLPNSGGWLDQSHKFNCILDIIEGEISKIEKIQQKTRDKK